MRMMVINSRKAFFLFYFELCVVGFSFASNTTNGEVCKSRVRRIVGGYPAKLPPYDDPLVLINFRGRFAKVRGVVDFPHYVFRGVRYAKPPIKKERFQRAKEHYLDGDVDATKFPPPCIQPIPGQNRIVGSEDCLFLNIFTPDLPIGTEGLPVVVWIHGGGFRYGSASQYGAKHLVGRQLLIVTIQYRLGSLGFLSSQSAELPGNVGLWDMVTAVKWVRNHIGYFGGNPYNINVMGHDSGASSAMFLALNKVARGYSNGVIALSGTAISNWATDDNPNEVIKTLAESQGCPTSSVLTMIKCLQLLPAQNIVQADSQIEISRVMSQGFMGAMSRSLGASPLVEGAHDGRSLPNAIENEPFKQMSEGNIPKIPLFTGVTKEETKRAINNIYKDDVLKSLQTVPDFLNKAVIEGLQSVTVIGKSTIADVKNKIWKQLDPVKFGKYINIGKNNINEAYSKITEATADALFNLPAFLSVDLWAKNKIPTFLYSFEHIPKTNKAHYFLSGLPFVGNTSNEDHSASHGEDLAFLFDAYTLDGEPLDLNEDFSEDDKNVRNVFVEAIANFARHKKVSFQKRELPSFSTANNNYFKISSTPKIETNFRFCEMGLWAGLTDRLLDSQCKLFNILDSELKNYQKRLFDIGNVASKPLPNFDISVGGITNQVTNKFPFQGIFGGK